MRQAFSYFVVATTLGWTSGCGSSSSSTATPPPPPADDAAAPVVDAAPAITVAGQITVTELTMYTMGMLMPSVSAAFGPVGATLGNQPTSAPIATEGACGVYYAAAGGGTPPAALNAGAITLTGGAQTVHLTYSPAGYGSDLGQMAASLYNNGQTLIADAAGGADIGAFHIQTPGPTKLAPLQPDFAAGLDLAATQPFDIAWNAASGPEASIFMEIVAQGTDPVTNQSASVTLSCGAPDQGKLTVPASLLAHLPRTANGMLMLTRFTTSMATVGTAQVELHVETTACSMGSIHN